MYNVKIELTEAEVNNIQIVAAYLENTNPAESKKLLEVWQKIAKAALSQITS